MINCLQPISKTPKLLHSTFLISLKSQTNSFKNHFINFKNFKNFKNRGIKKNRGLGIVCLSIVDPWTPSIDSQSIASQLFAVSLFPYIGFLYFITKSKSSPKLTLFGFYFLLAFVGATIPAGIYAKVHYGTSLSNVDWLHGGAESLLTLTNLFIVLGLRDALRKADNSKENKEIEDSSMKEKNNSSL